MAGYSTPHYASRSSRSTPYIAPATTGTSAASRSNHSSQKTLQEELEDARREQEVLRIQLRVANEENERMVSRLRSDLQQQFAQLQGRFEGTAEARELIQDNHNKALEIERLQHVCEKMEDQITHLRGECRTLSEAKDMLKLQLREERGRYSATQSELQAAQLEIQRLMTKTSSLEVSMHGSTSSSATKAKGLERSLAIAQEECRELADSYKRLQQQHEQALADYRTLKVEMDRLNRQSRQNHDEHQHEKDRLLARISQLTHETRTSDSQSRLQLETTIDDLRSSIRRLERDNAQQAASYRALQSENSQLHELLRQAETELQHARDAFAAEKQTFEQEVHHHLDQIERHRQTLADKLSEKDAQIAALQEGKNKSRRQRSALVETFVSSFSQLQEQVRGIAGVATQLAGQISLIGSEHESMKIGVENTSTALWQQMITWKEDADSSFRRIVDELSRLRGIDQEMEKQQSEFLSLTEEYKTAKQKVSALETAIKQLTLSVQDADARYMEAQEHHQALLQQADKTLAETRQQLHESKQRNSMLQSDLEKAVAQATELQQRIMEKQNEITKHQAGQGTKELHHQQQVAKLTAEMTALQRQVFDVTAARDKLQQQLLNSEKARVQEKQKFQNRLLQNQQEHENVATAMQQTKEGAKTLTSTLEKYHHQLLQTQALVQSLTRQKAELEKENRALKAQQQLHSHAQDQLFQTADISSVMHDDSNFVTPLVARQPAEDGKTVKFTAPPAATTTSSSAKAGGLRTHNTLTRTLPTETPARPVASREPNLTAVQTPLRELEFADPDDSDEAGLHTSTAGLSQWLKQSQQQQKGTEPVITLDVLAS